MASISRVIGIFVFCIVSSACSPLQQAPLVYSSKISVGVDVAATATEQPGLSASIGVKTVDAAYVPVAVAKPCDVSKMKESRNKNGSVTNSTQNENLKDCIDPIYKLEHIKASSEIGGGNGKNKDMEMAKVIIQDFQKFSSENDIAAKDLVIFEAKKILASKKVDELNSLIEEKNKNGEEDLVLTQLVAEHKNAELILAEYDKEYKAAKLKRDQADVKIKSFKLSELYDAFNLLSIGNDKADSYSVFGSFDSNTKVGGESGNNSPKVQSELALGKVFSTGVASQHLTEGMQKYYENSGIALVEKAKLSAICLSSGIAYLDSFKATLDLTVAADKKKLDKAYEDILALCKG